MEEQDWQTIVECAKDWKPVEIYYHKKNSADRKRYEVLPISERDHLIYLYDLKQSKIKAFVKNRVKLATKLPFDSTVTKEDIGYPIEIGQDEGKEDLSEM